LTRRAFCVSSMLSLAVRLVALNGLAKDRAKCVSARVSMCRPLRSQVARGAGRGDRALAEFVARSHLNDSEMRRAPLSTKMTSAAASTAAASQHVVWTRNERSRKKTIHICRR